MLSGSNAQQVYPISDSMGERYIYIYIYYSNDCVQSGASYRSFFYPHFSAFNCDGGAVWAPPDMMGERSDVWVYARVGARVGRR